MSKYVLLLATILFAWLPAHAQGYPKAEVFGGISIISISSGFDKRDQGFGWQASVAGNVHKNWGLVADVARQNKTLKERNVKVPLRIFEYLFGPQFNVRTGSATYSVHALFGGVHAGAGDESDNGFAMGIGGGIDVRASKSVSLRILQFDWLPNHVGDEWSSGEVRFGAGFVFKFGGS